MKLNLCLLLCLVMCLLAVNANQQIFNLIKKGNVEVEANNQNLVNNHPQAHPQAHPQTRPQNNLQVNHPTPNPSPSHKLPPYPKNTPNKTVNINIESKHETKDHSHAEYKYEAKVDTLPEALTNKRINKVKIEEHLITKKVEKNRSEIEHLKNQIKLLNEKNNILEQFVNEHENGKEVSMLQKVDSAVKNAETTFSESMEQRYKKLEDEVNSLKNERKSAKSDVEILKDALKFNSPSDKIAYGTKEITVEKLFNEIDALEKIKAICGNDLKLCIKRYFNKENKHLKRKLLR